MHLLLTLALLPVQIFSLVNAAEVFYNTQTLKDAVRLWNTDRQHAVSSYGEIEDWDVSRISNFDLVFGYRQINDVNLEKWDVSKVTSMSRGKFSHFNFHTFRVSDFNMTQRSLLRKVPQIA